VEDRVCPCVACHAGGRGFESRRSRLRSPRSRGLFRSSVHPSRSAREPLRRKTASRAVNRIRRVLLDGFVAAPERFDRAVVGFGPAIFTEKRAAATGAEVVVKAPNGSGKIDLRLSPPEVAHIGPCPIFPDLMGFRPVPAERFVDWTLQIGVEAQRAKRIDGRLPRSLIDLPTQISGAAPGRTTPRSLPATSSAAEWWAFRQGRRSPPSWA
jgi:hypothetical protein